MADSASIVKLSLSDRNSLVRAMTFLFSCRKRAMRLSALGRLYRGGLSKAPKDTTREMDVVAGMAMVAQLLADRTGSGSASESVPPLSEWDVQSVTAADAVSASLSASIGRVCGEGVFDPLIIIPLETSGKKLLPPPPSSDSKLDAALDVNPEEPSKSGSLSLLGDATFHWVGANWLIIGTAASFGLEKSES